jgi:hypothetical protein
MNSEYKFAFSQRIGILILKNGLESGAVSGAWLKISS